jgi:6-phosphogluconolactonase
MIRPMRIHRSETLDDVARDAAALLAERARSAVAARGRFTLALSGGSTPWLMLEHLARLDVPWSSVHVFQVDERAAEDGHPERNWTRLEESLFERVDVPLGNRHPMPVASTLDGRTRPEESAAQYAAEIAAVCPSSGAGPVFDLVQLGLGGDGHTASLVPGDPLLVERGRDVAWTERAYQGRRRMTLTLPLLDRARTRLWLVAGAGKAAVTERLVRGDPGIPAGLVSAEEETLLCVDAEAAAKLST